MRSEGQGSGVGDGADALCVAIKVQSDQRNKIKVGQRVNGEITVVFICHSDLLYYEHNINIYYK